MRYAIQCSLDELPQVPASTNTCVFVEETGLLPPLSKEQGSVLAVAIVTVWLAGVLVGVFINVLKKANS